MRLLNKNEVNNAKVLDRQREVAEGTKLAAKVDTLRELHAIEEKGLEDFRQKTVKQIREEIDGLGAHKMALLSDISELEQERKLLQIPLDGEWEKVTKLQQVLFEEKAWLDEREEKLTEDLEEANADAEELEKEKERVVDERERSKEMVASSGRILGEAKETLADVQSKADVILKVAEFREKETIHRELRVAAQERDNNMVTEHNRAWDNNLVTRERALKDKYATLERTMKRVNIKL